LPYPGASKLTFDMEKYSRYYYGIKIFINIKNRKKINKILLQPMQQYFGNIAAMFCDVWEIVFEINSTIKNNIENNIWEDDMIGPEREKYLRNLYK